MNPRLLHAGAWWMWALGLAAAASRTTNPLILGLIIAITGLVVSSRAEQAPWARAYSSALILGAIVLGVRVLFGLFFGLALGDHQLFALPQAPLPSWAEGIRIGGTITSEQLLLAFFDGLRLATIIVCIGAANALSSPLRLLKSVPGAIYELGVAIVVAMSLVPTLIADITRVREARRLRGRTTTGARGFLGLVTPVLEGSLRRSLDLAAAMDSRGYGRIEAVPLRARRGTQGLLVVGLMSLVVGMYLFLAGTGSSWIGPVALVIGLTAGVAGLITTGRRTSRSRYRPDPWLWPEWSVTVGGWSAAATIWWQMSHNTAALEPSLTPLQWPGLPALPLIGLAIATVTALATPPLPSDETSSRVPPELIAAEASA